jgi:hypothetical protein
MMKKGFWSLAALVAGLVVGLTLRAEESAPVVLETPGVSAVPEAPPPLADSLLFSPSWQSVREQFSKDLNQVEARRTRQLLSLLQRRTQEAEREVVEARRVRNATEIRVAQAFRETLETIRIAVTAGQPAVWPESVRPEMRARMKAFQDEFEAADRTGAEQVAAVRAGLLVRFSDALRAAGRTIPEDIDTLFSRWLAEDPPKPEEPSDPEKTPGVETPPPPEEAPPPEPPKEYFAESGPAEGEWTPVGRWTADMRGPDLFRIPVFDSREPGKGTQANQVSGQSSEWSWEPIQPLTPGTEYAFRLKRLEGCGLVDVVNWPSPDHPGELAIRTPYSSLIPNRVGFELQWAKRAVVEDPAIVEARRELAEKGIDVPVTTRPEGARVGVNGKVYRLPSGEVALTPCTVRLLPGVVRLTLVLEEYLPHDVAEFRVDKGVRLGWQFQSELDLPGTQVRVDSKTPWKAVKIEVKPGDKIWVIPEGTWVIGERSESCGAAGYDESKFSHYAAAKTSALRQVADAPYGALLMRIGVTEKSPPIVIEKPLRIVSSRVGVLAFDTNEIADPKARRDNRGVLTLKVIVLPKKKEVP